MPPPLSRRERQIMDALTRLGEASVADVHAELEDAPSYSAVRTTLGILVRKGHATHRADGVRYLYRSATSPRGAQRSALTHLLETFFDGDPAAALAALLRQEGDRLSPDELERLRGMIDDARRRGR